MYLVKNHFLFIDTYFLRLNYRYLRLWFTGTTRRLIGLDVGKTFQLSMGNFNEHTFEVGLGVGR